MAVDRPGSPAAITTFKRLIFIHAAMPSLSRRLARYGLEFSAGELASAPIEKTKRLILDSVAVSIPAYPSQPSKVLRRVYGGHRSEFEATVLGSTARMPVEYAALVNGLQGRYLDLNDIYTAAESVCHPSDHIPGLLAVAEAEGATGTDLIEAVILAYEIEGRGVDTGLLWRNGFDYVTWGSFSSAVAAGRLMGLSEDELVDAIGIVGTSSNALLMARLGDVSMWKAMAHPYVTHNAIQACQMARDGMTGPEFVFEGVEDRGGEGGFFDAVAREVFDLDALAGPDDRFCVEDASIKEYACAYYSHPAIYGALRIMDDHDLEAEDVEAIHLDVFEHVMQVYATPEKWSTDLNRETADHSLPYNVSVAVVDREVTPRQYEEDRLRDPRVHEMMQRVTVEPDEDLDRHRLEHPRHVPERITITTTDGRTFEERVNAPPGHPERPLDDGTLNRKATGLLSDFLTTDQIEAILETCYGLDELESVDTLVQNAAI